MSDFNSERRKDNQIQFYHVVCVFFCTISLVSRYDSWLTLSKAKWTICGSKRKIMHKIFGVHCVSATGRQSGHETVSYT